MTRHIYDALGVGLLAMLSVLLVGAKLPDPRSLEVDAKGLDADVLTLALSATHKARDQGYGADRDILTIIDFSMPSTRRRLWVIDLSSGKVLHHELVAHGKNSGWNKPTKFSNRVGSKQSSIGLFETRETYKGKHGYSLKLRGLERGVNDRAMERAIVIHGAWYVSEDFAKEHGRLGRSWGCPALEEPVSRTVIDRIKEGSLLFVYYPDKSWLKESRFLKE